jgi:voltage-gated potassium channel
MGILLQNSVMKVFLHKSVHFSKLMYQLVISAPFVSLSFYGNGTVVVFAAIFYWLESDVNPSIASFLDAVWWAFATTTTVGYGDVVPITTAGKLIGIALMLIGVAIFGIYTALFARAILDDEVYMQ